MKQIHVIFNPKKAKEYELQELCYELMKSGCSVSFSQTKKRFDAQDIAKDICNGKKHDLIIAFGGDGTLNEVVNGVMQANHRIPISVYSAGTMNDFAYFLDTPNNPLAFTKAILASKPRPVDIGQINDKYFINVFACGALTKVAHSTAEAGKNLIGPLAYYLEGIKEIPSIGKDRWIYLESDNYIYQGPYTLLLINNSSSTGGFRNISPAADIHDGVFNGLLIKKAPLADIIDIVLKVNSGEHVLNESVVYFKTRKIKVETEDEFDIDGEPIPDKMAEIKVLPSAIDILF